MLRVNSTLTTINLRYQLYNEEITTKGWKPLLAGLGVNRGIRWIDLGGREVGDTAASWLGKALRANTTLTTLQLEDNADITDGGWKAILGALQSNTVLTKLGMLSQQQCGLLGDEGTPPFFTISTPSATFSVVCVVSGVFFHTQFVKYLGRWSN